MKKYKVALILEATTGGTRRHVVDLALNLDKNRYSVSLICSTLRDNRFLVDVDVLRNHGVEVCVIRMRRAICPLSDVIAFARIYWYLRKHDFSIVHTHSSKAGILGRAAARLARVPVIIHTPHVFAFEMDVYESRKRFYRRLEKMAARVTNRIICVCEHEKDVVTESNVASPQKCVVVENGIHESRQEFSKDDRLKLRSDLGLDADDKVVGMIARFTKQKGHNYLVHAARSIVNRIPNAKFVLIGNGQLKPEIWGLIEHLCLERNFVLTGQREDALGFLPAFDVIALPSLWEGLPYVLLQGMAAGLPVVATRVGGIVDVLASGRAGLLVPRGDSDALASALIDLLNNENLRIKLGTGARTLMTERYRLADMICGVQAVYESLLEKIAQEC